MFWSGEQRILIRLGSFLYDTSREVGGIKMLSKGSDLKAVENVVGNIVDKQVMAGWRSVTRIFTHGSFPEVGQKQKTEKKEERKTEQW